MERDEIFGESVQFVLPVSGWLHERLRDSYPDLNTKATRVAWPGVDFHDTYVSPQPVPDARFLFVGKEFIRKGFGKVSIVREYRNQTGNDATLDILLVLMLVHCPVRSEEFHLSIL